MKKHYELRCELTELVADGTTPNAQTARYFKAEFWPLDSGIDYLLDDLATTHAKELEKLVKLGLEGLKDSVGEDPAWAIGRLVMRAAEKRAQEGYDVLLEECMPGEPDYGYDESPLRRMSLDRDVA